MHNKNRSLLFVIAIFSIFLAAPSIALGFNYNYIISDSEAINYDSMNQVEIKKFLQSKNSFLSNYWYEGNNPATSELAIDPDEKYFKKRSATEIIYNAAQEAKINPQVILTMLQKEMGLIEDPSPSEKVLSIAMGYGCPDSGGCYFKFKGFGKQVRSASLQLRHFIDNIYEYKHQPDMRSCVDDYTPYLPCTAKATEIKPANKITAAMYIYTPHVSGNKLFATLWNKYGFNGLVEEVPEFLEGIFPNGALVKASDGEDTAAIYLIVGDQKRAFASMSALVSRFNPDNILSVESTELNNYSTGAIIEHANYSLLSDSAGNKYLIDGLTKRLIESDEAFRQLGFNPLELVEVNDEALDNYSDGEIISGDSSPFAEVLQDSATAATYYVKDGQKSPIIDAFIASVNYPNLSVREVTTKTLSQFTSVAPAKLSDGTLIKKASDKNVYVISSGERRLIPDGATFEKLGYNWANIIDVSNKVFNFHSVGVEL